MMEHFFKNTTAKTCQLFLQRRLIVDVWYGSKHTPEVVQDSEMNLKWKNTKMPEKTAFLQRGSYRWYPCVEISQDIRSSS